jgi:hypothetical protein
LNQRFDINEPLSQDMKAIGSAEIHHCYYNLIIHTVWLDNHELTLEIYREKLYFGEKSIVCIPFWFFDLNPSKVKLKK